MTSITQTASSERREGHVREDLKSSVQGKVRPWKPVLQDELRQAAWKRIEEIDTGLRAFCDQLEHDDGWRRRFPAHQHTLSGGQAGIALFYAYLDRYSGHQDSARSDFVIRCIDQSIEGIGKKAGSPGLYSGFVGVSWALEHLRDELGLSDQDDPLLEIENVLARHLDQRPWLRDYDLVKGLVGYGVFSLDRLPRSLAETCLRSVVQRLTELAERDPAGTARWHTDAKLNIDITQGAYPHGCYNLGLAHGIPGVIALLAKIADVGIAEAQARDLATGAVDWLLTQKFEVLGISADALFPRKVAPGVDPLIGGPTGLAWCYGDLGIACSLLLAARLLREEPWEKEAIAIGLSAARRDDENLVEPGLCHGAAGVGHLFNRLYQATGRGEFRDAAIRWLGETLNMRREGETIAGYAARGEDENGLLAWRPYPGILTGAAGIGMALLAAISDIEPEWDRFMLVS